MGIAIEIVPDKESLYCDTYLSDPKNTTGHLHTGKCKYWKKRCRGSTVAELSKLTSVEE